MKIFSHPMQAPDGVWLMLHWAGSDEEIALAKHYGLIPEAASEVLSIVLANNGTVGDLAFELMPVDASLLQ